MYLHYVETTLSGQPTLRELEKDIFVCKKVGLSLGRHKILNKQCGRLYLTTERLIYIDDVNFKSESCYIDFNDVLKFEFSSGFWKSSPKIIIYFKDQDKQDNEGSGFEGIDGGKLQTVGWNCPICMMNNESNIVSEEESFICINCGVPCDYEYVIEENDKNQKREEQSHKDIQNLNESKNSLNECPRCTFVNHKYINTCEMCGAKLINFINQDNLSTSTLQRDGNKSAQEKFFDPRVKVELGEGHSTSVDKMILLSLRDKYQNPENFYELVSSAFLEHTMYWNQEKFNQGSISNESTKGFSNSKGSMNVNIEKDTKKFGLSSLEEIHESKLVQSDIIMGSALQDLNKLISMSQDIVKLYSSTTGESAKQEVFMKPSNLVADRGRFQDRMFFLSEMSREIFDFVLNLSERNENSLMINLIDLYAMYNKTIRVGCGFISPTEFKESCQYFEKLKLSDNLHIMSINKSKIQYLTTKKSLEKFQNSLLSLIKDSPGLDLYFLNKYLQDIDGSKTWSIGIINELLKILIDRGKIVIDQDIVGRKFYLNEYWSY